MNHTSLCLTIETSSDNPLTIVVGAELKFYCACREVIIARRSLKTQTGDRPIRGDECIRIRQRVHHMAELNHRCRTCGRRDQHLDAESLEEVRIQINHDFQRPQILRSIERHLASTLAAAQ